MRIRLLWLLAGLWLSCGAAHAADSLAPKTLDTSRLAPLTERLTSDVQAGALPGAVLLIFSQGRQVHFEAVGSLDPAAPAPAPMPADAIFRIESMSKPLTTAAALLLVESGQLHLDDPLTKHLPAYTSLMVLHEGPGANDTPALEDARTITVRDLMRHTAGLDYGWLAPRSARSRQLNATSRHYPRDFSSADLTDWLLKAPLAAQPGTVWNYSSSIDVLGRVIEVVSGKSLGSFLKERLFDPLEMRDTFFFVTKPDQARRIAEPLAGERAGMADPRVVRRLEAGGQGLHATAHDYARFLQMLLNGGELDGKRVLSRESVKLMTTDQLGDISRGANYSPGSAYGFGFGFAVRTASHDASLPGEPGDFWWGGGTGTYAWADPVNQLVVVFMMQSRSLRAPYRPILRSAVYDALR